MNRVNKVLLVESSPIISLGLNFIIEKSTLYNVVATVSDFDRINDRLVVLKPDIVIMNPLLLDYSKRFEISNLFKNFPHLLVVALVYTYIDPNILRHFHAVIDINDNLKKIESKLKEAFSLHHVQESDNGYDLSDREKEVLIAVAKGKMNKEIAEQLNISINTVITHRKNVMAKTNIKSIAGLTVYAILNNMIEADDI